MVGYSVPNHSTTRPPDRLLDFFDERLLQRGEVSGDGAPGGVLVATATELLGDAADVDVALRAHRDAELVPLRSLEEHDGEDFLDRQRQVHQPFGVFISTAC